MLFPSYAPNSYHCLCSAWPIYPVPSLVVAIPPCAFALTRRANATLIDARPSLCSELSRSSFAFLPTASLCLCSGSPYRRGSVLGWSMLCRRRAAPCVVWLFNAVACRSKSHLIYAMPPPCDPTPSFSGATQIFAMPPLIGTQPSNAPAGHSISYLRCANAKHFGATPPLLSFSFSFLGYRWLLGY